MQIDYGKLSEQYASFLSALGGVSITVLTLVLSFDRLKNNKDGGAQQSSPLSDDVNKGQGAEARGDGGGDQRPVESDSRGGDAKTELKLPDYLPHLIAALIVATLASFVGAHLMAETASFVNSFISGQASREALKPAEPLGQRLFLLASINIYIATTVVIYALVLLTAYYKKTNEDIQGIRRFSLCIFYTVVFCIICWMFVSATWRMPSPNWWVAEFAPVVGVVVVVAALCLWWRESLWNRAVRVSLISILLFVVGSLVWFAVSMHYPNYNGATTDLDIGIFVTAVSSTCVSLFFMVRRLVGHGDPANLWPVEDAEWREKILQRHITAQTRG